MSWKQVAGRGTWLGAAVAALVLLAGEIYAPGENQDP